MGSVTKTFVATVLLQMEAEGRLDLDDSVEEWLPGAVRGHGHDGRRITLRQLLNHTSGVYSFTSDPDFAQKVFGPDFLRHRYDTWTPSSSSRSRCGTNRTSPPARGGTTPTPTTCWPAWSSRRPPAGRTGEEIERRILRPLGLRATSVPGTSAAMPRPSGRAYSTLGADPSDPATRIHDVTELNPSLAHAAGEMVSDNSDLQRFLRALLAGRLLPREQMRELTATVPVGEDGIRAYGLGVYVQELSCGEKVWGHTGGIHGSGSLVMATRDGRHSMAGNVNGDWVGLDKVLEAEFCG